VIFTVHLLLCADLQMDAHDATRHHAGETRGFRLGDGETPCRYATRPIMLSSRYRNAAL